LPVAVGFGISSPESASTMFEAGADGVITGSKIIQILGRTESDESNVKSDESNVESSESNVESSESNVKELSAFSKSMVSAGKSKIFR